MRKFSLLLLLAVSAIAISSKVVINSFTASYQGADVRLEWRVSKEENVTAYEIHRKRNEDQAFTKIGNVTAINTGSYTFIDENLYKTDEVQSGITYKLLVKNTDNTTASYYTTINSNPTAVQRSWGSIKSMFR
jgi:hypothetical protein